MKLIDRLYTPQWAGGWTAARFGFVAAASYTWLPRGVAIPDVYAVDDMIFSRGPFRLADHVVLSEPTGYGLWAAAMLGLVSLAWGGRAAKPGLLLFLLGSWLLLAAEALNIKAYDRLLTWVALGLLLGPVGERGLTKKARSPFGRWFLLIAFAALYGSTGWLKAIEAGEGWRSGDVLAHHLVHRWFGMNPLGVWLSDKVWFTAPASWFTLFMECGFPFLCWFRRTNALILAAGVALHVGIASVMNVGAFSYVALAAYPVLLHPETARQLHRRITGASTDHWRRSTPG